MPPAEGIINEDQFTFDRADSNENRDDEFEQPINSWGGGEQ